MKKKTCCEWDANELLSIFFQICFGLAVAQKQFCFVHNDLHASNIMFKHTEEKFIYYRINNKYFKIPTYNKVVKIIDFGRATFYFRNRFYVSDVFAKNGDAEDQVSYPFKRNSKNIPNRSFDLSLLAVTIVEFFTEEFLENNKDIQKLLKRWTTDKNNNLITEEDSFDLYINIARLMENAIPYNQLNDIVFDKFIVMKEEIDDANEIYRL